jgi:hypothetical protein
VSSDVFPKDPTNLTIKDFTNAINSLLNNSIQAITSNFPVISGYVPKLTITSDPNQPANLLSAAQATFTNLSTLNSVSSQVQ